MKKRVTMQEDQLERFARFLEEHPGFSPLLMGEDALVAGFQMGTSGLEISEMEIIIAVQPHFDLQQAAVLLAPGEVLSRRR
jgi:hypothetical protein